MNKIKDPMHPGEITPEWITHALHGGGVLNNSSAIKLDKKLIGDEKGFLSSVVRVNIEYDKPEQGAPSSVVVKIEPEEGDFKDFGDELNAFQREIRFYEEVAGNVPVRLPRIYYTVDEPPAFSMVMEDLSAFTPGDQIVGMHEGQVNDTVDMLAKIQARYWNNEVLEGLTWMPDSNGVSDDYADKWGSMVEHFGHFLSPEGIGLGSRLAGHIDWKNKEIARRQKTIVHSDLREDNLLFPPPGSDETILILDWQLAVKSNGAFDVARLLGGSEIPKERKGHHFEVLRRWYDTLVAQGVEGYSWDAAVYDFRLASLSFLCYPVHFHVGVIGATGRTKELARVIVTRSFASAVEVDAGQILPD